MHKVLKTTSRYLIILVLLLVMGCATSHIGKKLPPRDYPEFDSEDSGKHSFVFDKLDIHYEWRIDRTKGEVVFDGGYTVKDHDWLTVLHSRMKNGNINFGVVFLDEDYTVIGQEYFTIFVSAYSDINNSTTFVFRETFDYDPKFKYVFFYKVYMYMTYRS